MVSTNTRVAGHHRQGIKPQLLLEELPYHAAKTPNRADIQLNRKFGIIHREDHSVPQRRGRSSTERTSPSVQNFFPNMSASTTNRTRVFDESRKQAHHDDGILANGKDSKADDEDNMSLISMTNLIAEDICQMKNCRYENIGPDIRDIPKSKKASKRGDRKTAKKASKSSRRGKKPEAPTKRQVYTVWDNNPPLHTAGYGTSDTGSLTSRQSSTEDRASSIEFEVIDQSDNISEITPTGCPIDGTNKTRKRRHTSNRDNKRKELSPEENFQELLSSMAACLPNLADPQDVRRSVSDAQTKFDSIGTRNILSQLGITDNCCEPNQTSNGTGMQANRNSILYKTFDNTPGSVASAPATPLFKNNLDRYNRLVIGIVDDDDQSTLRSMDNKQHRKYSRTWFKTKREINKRRNNTQILQAPAPAPSTRKQRPQKNESQGGTNVEVVWQQSKSFKEHKKILNAKGSVEAIPTPLTKTQTRTPIFKKLLKRGKGKEPTPQEETVPVVPAVSITAKDPRKWQPDETEQLANLADDQLLQDLAGCVKTTGDVSIDLCNSDVTMAIVGAPLIAAANTYGDFGGLDSLGVPPRVTDKRDSKRDNKSKKPSVKPVVTKNNASSVRKNSSRIRQGDQAADFKPIWPKTNADDQNPYSSLPRDKTKLPRKKRLNCYHRTSQRVDLEDNDSRPKMPWARSRSYDEDDCGQEDLKVVSIIGHHVSSSALEQCATSFRKDKGVITHSPPFESHRKKLIAEQKLGSPSSSTAYCTSSSSESSSCSSLSDSSQQRRSRVTRTSNHFSPYVGSTRSRDKEINIPSSDKALGIAAAPWGTNSRIAPKTAPMKFGVPVAPPKIQRSTDPHGVFHRNSVNRSTANQLNVNRRTGKVERNNVAL